VEDRVARSRSERPGPALIALVLILMVTATWWALALFPAGAAEPEWLTRTRAACFGSAHGGLPDAGGWILLVGEPVGMLVALLAGWGDSVRRDLAIVRSRAMWRATAAVAGVLIIAGLAATGVRVVRAVAVERSVAVLPPGTPVRVDAALPSVTLVDQHGQQRPLDGLQQQPMLLTFAFGHCATVCPTIVSDLRAARRRAGRTEVPIVVITLDPWRDTPDRLPTIAQHWMLAPGDRVLSGDTVAVERALDALEIGRRRDETTGDIDHAVTAMMVERGRIAWRVEGGVGGVTELLARSRR
jgi:cytochrome oxidase Cu insertion factor (SCO1/SenC/PrrC family)